MMTEETPDPEAACGSVVQVAASLERWQGESHGKQAVMVAEWTSQLGRLSEPCQGAPESVDLARTRDDFLAWSRNVRDQSRIKTGWGTIALWALIPALVSGVLIYWKRRFHDA